MLEAELECDAGLVRPLLDAVESRDVALYLLFLILVAVLLCSSRRRRQRRLIGGPCRSCATDRTLLGTLRAEAHDGVGAERDRSDERPESAFAVVVVLCNASFSSSQT